MLDKSHLANTNSPKQNLYRALPSRYSEISFIFPLEKNLYKLGTTKSVNKVAVIKPPTMTLASGL